MKPVQRLNKASREVLEEYHADADTAIMTMRNEIVTLKSKVTLIEVTKPLQGGFDEPYWKRLRSEVDKAIENRVRY
jgi:hypothetical protein